MPEITLGKSTISLEEYKGVFSLVEGWINREGDFKPNWCKRTFGQNAPEQNTPVKIRIGNKEDIEKLARFLLAGSIDEGKEPLPF